MLTVENIQGHYELYIDGVFYCSCDTYEEVQEEIEFLESEVLN